MSPDSPFGAGLPDRIDGKCAGFAWVGQPFTSCDVCGTPYWEHEYDRVFDGGGETRVPIPPGLAEGVRRKWGPKER